MKLLLLFLIFSAIGSPHAVMPGRAVSDAPIRESQTPNLVGRWRVKFNLSGVGEKTLVLHAQAKGSGSILLLDTAPDGKPATASLPAAWSQTTANRLSFSGEAELPIGTCCREMGTLIFKGHFKPDGTISGAAIFVTGTVDVENHVGHRSLLGVFTAAPISPIN